jgi:hypothetical protein
MKYGTNHLDHAKICIYGLYKNTKPRTNMIHILQPNVDTPESQYRSLSLRNKPHRHQNTKSTVTSFKEYYASESDAYCSYLTSQ